MKENAGCYDYPDCSEEPCQHGGTCTEGPDGCEELSVDQEIVMVDCYTCTCAYGWTGFDCEIDEDECKAGKKFTEGKCEGGTDIPVIADLLCKGDATAFDAGWGNCLTYADSNKEYCDQDKDKNTGLRASGVCPECGVCQAVMKVR